MMYIEIDLGTSGVKAMLLDGEGGLRASGGASSSVSRSQPRWTKQDPQAWWQATPDSMDQLMLDAVSSLDFVARLSGYADVAEMSRRAESIAIESRPSFMPYLGGEQRPLNDAYASGVWFGMYQSKRRVDLVHAVQKGVGLGPLNGVDALEHAGATFATISVIGGGTRSSFWPALLADIPDRALELREGSDLGPAIGVVRLARLAVNEDENPSGACPPPPLREVLKPRADRHEYYLAQRQPVFRELYGRMRGLRRDGAAAPVRRPRAQRRPTALIQSRQR